MKVNYIKGAAGAGKSTALKDLVISKLKGSDRATILTFTKSDSVDMNNKLQDRANILACTMASLCWRISHRGEYTKYNYGRQLIIDEEGTKANYLPPIFCGIQEQETESGIKLEGEPKKPKNNYELFKYQKLKISYPYEYKQDGIILNPVYKNILEKRLDRDKLTPDEDAIYKLWTEQARPLGFTIIDEALYYSLYEANLKEVAEYDKYIDDNTEKERIIKKHKLAFLSHCNLLAIDEAQDMNRWELALIEKIIKEYSIKEVIICGDPNQTIYQKLRSADSCLTKWAETKTQNPIILKYNYRATQELTDFPDNLINDNLYIEGVEEIPRRTSKVKHIQDSLICEPHDSLPQPILKYTYEAMQKFIDNKINSIAILAHSMGVLHSCIKVLDINCIPYKINTTGGRHKHGKLLKDTKGFHRLTPNNFYNIAVLYDKELDTDGDDISVDRVLACLSLFKGIGLNIGKKYGLTRDGEPYEEECIEVIEGYSSGGYMPIEKLVKNIFETSSRRPNYNKEIWKDYDLKFLEPLTIPESIKDGTPSLIDTPLKNSEVGMAFWEAVAMGDTEVLKNRHLHRHVLGVNLFNLNKSYYDQKVISFGWDYNKFNELINNPIIMSNIYQFKGKESDFVIATSFAFNSIAKITPLESVRLAYTLISRARKYMRLLTASSLTTDFYNNWHILNLYGSKNKIQNKMEHNKIL